MCINMERSPNRLSTYRQKKDMAPLPDECSAAYAREHTKGLKCHMQTGLPTQETEMSWAREHTLSTPDIFVKLKLFLQECTHHIHKFKNKKYILFRRKAIKAVQKSSLMRMFIISLLIFNTLNHCLYLTL